MQAVILIAVEKISIFFPRMSQKLERWRFYEHDQYQIKIMMMVPMTVVGLRFYKCVVEEALLGKDPDGAEDFSAGFSHQHPQYHHHNHHKFWLNFCDMLYVLFCRSIFDWKNLKGATKARNYIFVLFTTKNCFHVYFLIWYIALKSVKFGISLLLSDKRFAVHCVVQAFTTTCSWPRIRSAFNLETLKLETKTKTKTITNKQCNSFGTYTLHLKLDIWINLKSESDMYSNITCLIYPGDIYNLCRVY